MQEFKEYLTFDDVLLVPNYSEVLPHQVDVSTRITKNIKINIPLISAAMDTVTESTMAIAMAQNGGIGCIHKNMTIQRQAEEVKRVKKFESGMIVDPITIESNSTIKDALKLMEKYNISGIPVTDKKGKLEGILTNRDVRFSTDKNQLVSDLMTKDLITVKSNVTQKHARDMLHKHKIEKLLVVDKDFKCTGLITVKDIQKAKEFPDASKDSLGRLRVAAAVGPGADCFERAESLIDAGVDIIIIDTAHGHSKGVIETVREIKKKYKKIDIIAGNIATSKAAEDLIKAGVDGVKVGIGPGSICTTRVVAGIGVPQLSAIMDVAKTCKKHDIPLIADGGVKYSGDLAKAIAVGADIVMIGGMFAGTEESPGEIILYQGRSYKLYRGMGSIGAMAKGSADRYFQQDVKKAQKLVPEGVEGRVPYKGMVSDVIHQLIGGLRAAMGYCGNKNIKLMKNKCQIIKISNAGLRESHPHDITITREAPNYGVSE